MRALWVEAQASALKSPDSVQKLVADARGAGFNTLFVQVRRNGDALYRSQIVPADPGLAKDFDPLGFLIRQARTGGAPLKVHGVLTMCRVWSNADGTPPDNHVAKQHAEWLTRQPNGKEQFGAGAGELWLDLGVAEAQDHMALIAADLARHYDLDGIVLDRLRYPDAELRAGYSLRAISRFDAAMKRRDAPPPEDPEVAKMEAPADDGNTAQDSRCRPRGKTQSGSGSGCCHAWRGTGRPAGVHRPKPAVQSRARRLGRMVHGRTGGRAGASGFQARQHRGGRVRGMDAIRGEEQGPARLVVAVAGWLNPPDMTAAMMLYPVLDPAADGVALYSYENPSNNPAAPAEAFAAFQRAFDPAFVQPRAAAAAPLLAGSAADFPTRFSQLVRLAAAPSPTASVAAAPATAPPATAVGGEMATIVPPPPAAPIALQPTPATAPSYSPDAAILRGGPTGPAPGMAPGALAPPVQPDAGVPSLSELNAARAGGMPSAASPPRFGAQCRAFQPHPTPSMRPFSPVAPHHAPP